ncbi:hypothetical protein Y10_07860 [Neptunitalea sp. Y10]|uniref:Uncharacterized protein n=1 Tax=Neptunitalea lumnitzerae TaxID=2965509 RepID=A0ABQ5MG85_9FLAO|nr:hypothetical protein Y10_07860 [Neptunitalea sp. Y10]
MKLINMMLNKNMINVLKITNLLIEILLVSFLFLLGIAGGHYQINNFIIEAFILLVSSVIAFVFFKKTNIFLKGINYLGLTVSLILIILILNNFINFGNPRKLIFLTFIKLMMCISILVNMTLILIKLNKK